MSRTLFLVRHCESEANRAGVLDGYPNARLTELGRAQALELGARFGGWRPNAPYLITSPLLRALHTAEAIGAELSIAAQRDARLSAGEARAGQTFAEAGEEVAAAIADSWPPANDTLIAVTHRFPLRGYLIGLYGPEEAARLVDKMANGDVLEIAFDRAPAPATHHSLGI